MAALLMSIGLSVDYTAHVAYHFQQNSMNRFTADGRAVRVALVNRHEKLRHTIEAVGWPMLQAGISTVLCVAPMILIQVSAFWEKFIIRQMLMYMSVVWYFKGTSNSTFFVSFAEVRGRRVLLHNPHRHHIGNVARCGGVALCVERASDVVHQRKLLRHLLRVVCP